MIDSDQWKHNGVPRNSMTAIKPQIDRLRQWIRSIEHDARMSSSDKAALLSTMEGLLATPAALWRARAALEHLPKEPAS
jgi:hypothetical protein